MAQPNSKTITTRIAAAKRDESRSPSLAHIVAAAVANSGADANASDAISSFVEAYIQMSAALLASLEQQAARDAAWAPALQLVLTPWHDGWDFLPTEGAGLIGILDNAYASTRTLETIAGRLARTKGECRFVGGQPEVASRAVRSLLGSFGPEIDERVSTLCSEDALKGLTALATNGPALEASARVPSVPGGIQNVSLGDVLSGTRAMAAPPPTAGREAPAGPRQYDVWFATNRAPKDPDDIGKGFANSRDPERLVRYGICSVDVPKSHEFGSTGTAWWKRWLKLRFEEDRLKLSKISPLASADEFFGEIAAEFRDLDSELSHDLLVYLHGYNVSFEEAAIRAAQMGVDLKPGATAFFSWPSMDAVQGYAADGDRVAASEAGIADFLVRLSRESGAGSVHVIAHSMGNRGFLRAMQRLLSRAADIADVRFGQIILAAPDVDVDLFKGLAHLYGEMSQRTTMYVSARDRALKMSQFLQDSDRAGFTPPVTVVPKIDTVEVTNIDLTLLGHSYYAEAEGVLYDIQTLLTSNTPPARRARLGSASTATGERYWIIDR